MARYNSPVRDWSVRTPAALRRPTRAKTCDMTLQQGVTQFSRKKKNGSKLWSSAQLGRAADRSAAKVGRTTVAVAFPPIKL
jgi:hypothetical protein